eukprot:TRINITY_DN6023_c0_g3_i4.p2 TRINITY_DN6023_c0_g3~~TRINITY_DN6023_c0_g3_i4.p2  ORF type:complete len:239 (-),score=-15.91 TRINITY_DN6023_c0_g3_i4:671-1387(-)
MNFFVYICQGIISTRIPRQFGKFFKFSFFQNKDECKKTAWLIENERKCGLMQQSQTCQVQSLLCLIFYIIQSWKRLRSAFTFDKCVLKFLQQLQRSTRQKATQSLKYFSVFLLKIIIRKGSQLIYFKIHIVKYQVATKIQFDELISQTFGSCFGGTRTFYQSSFIGNAIIYLTIITYLLTIMEIYMNLKSLFCGFFWYYYYYYYYDNVAQTNIIIKLFECKTYVLIRYQIYTFIGIQL